MFVELSQESTLRNPCDRSKNNYIAGIQAMSDTCALRELFNFRKNNCLKKSGLPFEMKAMLDDLKNKSNKRDAVLLHGCAHNSTGVDPTKDQWAKIDEASKDTHF